MNNTYIKRKQNKRKRKTRKIIGGFGLFKPANAPPANAPPANAPRTNATPINPQASTNIKNGKLINGNLYVKHNLSVNPNTTQKSWWQFWKK